MLSNKMEIGLRYCCVASKHFHKSAKLLMYQPFILKGIKALYTPKDMFLTPQFNTPTVDFLGMKFTKEKTFGCCM